MLPSVFAVTVDEPGGAVVVAAFVSACARRCYQHENTADNCSHSHRCLQCGATPRWLHCSLCHHSCLISRMRQCPRRKREERWPSRYARTTRRQTTNRRVASSSTCTNRPTDCSIGCSHVGSTCTTTRSSPMSHWKPLQYSKKTTGLLGSPTLRTS